MRKLTDIVNKVMRNEPITARERQDLKTISHQLSVVADIAKVIE